MRAAPSQNNQAKTVDSDNLANVANSNSAAPAPALGSEAANSSSKVLYPQPGGWIRSVLILGFACFFLYFLGLGSYPAVDPAEAYYVEAAREMLDIGNFITPHLNYQIYFSKPIMTFWLMAGSYLLFGVSEASARLPFQLLASLMVFATYYTGRKIAGERAGLFAGLSLAAAPLLLLVARESPIDIAFSAFLSLALLATTLCLSGLGKFSWPFIYVGLGLAMLTKGPAAILLYLMGAGGFLVLSRPSFKMLGEWLRELRLLPGLGIFFLTILPWHVAVWSQTEGLFLKVFFLYENVARYAGHTNMGRMSVWFFIPVLIVGYLPFISLLFPAVKEVLLGGTGLPTIREDCRKRGLAFLLAFSATTFAFFSFSGTKLITYILPVLAPLALITGVFMDRLVISKSRESASTAAGASAGAAAGASAGASADTNSDSDSDSDSSTGTDAAAGAMPHCASDSRGLPTGSAENRWQKVFSCTMLAYSLALFAGLAFALFYFSGLSSLQKILAVTAGLFFVCGSFYQFKLARSGDFLKSVYVSFAVLVSGLSILATVGAAVFYGQQQGDLMRISQKAGQASEQVHMFGVFMPSSMFYARKPVNTFFLARQFKPVDSGDGVKRSSLIVRDRDLPKLKEVPDLKLEPVSREGQWGLYYIPGFDVEKVMILEDVFRNPELFERLMSGDTSMGPLTVPYAAGRARGQSQ